MPPIVALLLCTIFARWLLRKQARVEGKLSAALWIPLIWLFIYSTRPVAAWLGSARGEGDLDGNPIDAIIIFGLIGAAFFVLNRRGFPWGTLASLNVAFFAIFFYFAISMAWAPYPFVAFKRWFKELGHIFVVLIILTEADPASAFKAVCLRLSTLLFPLSVVLFKYYPQWGRAYSHSGEPMVTGVTPQKNSLGQICCLYGFVLLWDMVDTWRNREGASFWRALGPKLIVFGIGMGLLIECQSKTSLLALLIGTAAFFSTQIGLVRRSAPFFAKCAFVGTCVGLVVAAVWTFAIAPLLEAFGRDATFTERTKIWETALKQDINPWVGSGFFSFWLDKGESVWAEFEGGFRPRTVHSGYLETYLDGGYLACALLGIFLLFTGWRTAKLVSPSSTLSRGLFAIVLMALVMNFSETSFFRLDALWFALVLSALACHPLVFHRTVTRETASQSRTPEMIHEAAV